MKHFPIILLLLLIFNLGTNAKRYKKHTLPLICKKWVVDKATTTSFSKGQLFKENDTVSFAKDNKFVVNHDTCHYYYYLGLRLVRHTVFGPYKIVKMKNLRVMLTNTPKGYENDSIFLREIK